MYKQDLALDKLQGLKCHGTQPTNVHIFATRVKQSSSNELSSLIKLLCLRRDC